MLSHVHVLLVRQTHAFVSSSLDPRNAATRVQQLHSHQQNTFIDDLFAFIIRMPTMARMSCFRDDVVFFVYLWQRYLYPVDTSRP
eukprot:7374566-Prorocentrum_lima.AAC.1